MYQEYRSIAVSNGHSYDVNDLLKKVHSRGASNIPVSKLDWVLDHDTPQAGRLESADPSYPIIVTTENGKLVALDGLHRLAKAKLLGMKTIPAKVLEENEMSEIRHGFSPDLTPDQMNRLGVLHGVYTKDDPRKNNFFGVPASMKTWNETWLHESAPQGWYEWYQGYVQGKRTPDDERQMKRWASFRARHVAQLEKADPSLKNLSIQPKRRQALLNWGIASGIDVDRALEAGSVNKYLEKVASKKEKDSVGMIHKGGIAYGSGFASSLASYPVIHGLKKSMDKDLPKSRVTEADVASYRKAKNLRHVKRHGGDGIYMSPHHVNIEAYANKDKFFKPSRNRLGEIHATNPAVAMHEYGHAHSYKSQKRLRGIKTTGYSVSALAHNPLGRLALAATATSKDDRKSKGAVAASVALSAPQLVEEARASISPYKHLKKTQGKKVANQFGKTMGKAFGTYGVNAAATVGATVMARSWAKSVRAKKDKENATMKHL